MVFSFEKLTVYQESLKWIGAVDGICVQAKGKVSADMRSQLSRAALSVALNIAEGSGRWHPADKRQFFWIARGSVFECVPLVEVLRIRGIIEPELYEQCRQTLALLGRMLSGLTKAVERRPLPSATIV